MKLTKYTAPTGPKSSVKVTYNDKTNTAKLRFRKADGSVDDVKVYQPNDPMMMVDMYRWNKFGLLPDSLKGTLIPAMFSGKTEILENLSSKLLN